MAAMNVLEKYNLKEILEREVVEVISIEVSARRTKSKSKIMEVVKKFFGWHAIC